MSDLPALPENKILGWYLLTVLWNSGQNRRYISSYVLTAKVI